MDHKYRISIRIGNTSFDLESTDLAWLEKKEQEYLAKYGATPEQQQTSTSAGETVLLPRNLTINEFYKKYIRPNNITSRPDIAVFFVYYLQKILTKDSIRTTDITQCFADVSYPNYNRLNITDILNQAKKKALLNSVNNLWSLTITGEDFVLNNMMGKTK